jgi:hypothetical protein
VQRAAAEPQEGTSNGVPLVAVTRELAPSSPLWGSSKLGLCCAATHSLGDGRTDLPPAALCRGVDGPPTGVVSSLPVASSVRCRMGGCPLFLWPILQPIPTMQQAERTSSRLEEPRGAGAEARGEEGNRRRAVASCDAGVLCARTVGHLSRKRAADAATKEHIGTLCCRGGAGRCGALLAPLCFLLLIPPPPRPHCRFSRGPLVRPRLALSAPTHTDEQQ